MIVGPRPMKGCLALIGQFVVFVILDIGIIQKRKLAVRG